MPKDNKIFSFLRERVTPELNHFVLLDEFLAIFKLF